MKLENKNNNFNLYLEKIFNKNSINDFKILYTKRNIDFFLNSKKNENIIENEIISENSYQNVVNKNFSQNQQQTNLNHFNDNKIFDNRNNINKNILQNKSDQLNANNILSDKKPNYNDFNQQYTKEPNATDSVYISRLKIRDIAKEKKIFLSDSETDEIYKYFCKHNLNELDLNLYLNKLYKNSQSKIMNFNVEKNLENENKKIIQNHLDSNEDRDDLINSKDLLNKNLYKKVDNENNFCSKEATNGYIEKNHSLNENDNSRIKDTFKLTLLEEEQKKTLFDLNLEKMKNYFNEKFDMLESKFFINDKEKNSSENINKAINDFFLKEQLHNKKNDFNSYSSNSNDLKKDIENSQNSVKKNIFNTMSKEIADSKSINNDYYLKTSEFENIENQSEINREISKNKKENFVLEEKMNNLNKIDDDLILSENISSLPINNESVYDELDKKITDNLNKIFSVQKILEDDIDPNLKDDLNKSINLFKEIKE